MPCHADSLASSASSAGSASVGSLSTSIRGCSHSCSRDTPVANGDYRIVEIAVVAEHPSMRRLKLQATAPRGQQGELFLDLPQRTLARAGLAPRDIVSMRHRPYGLELYAPIPAPRSSWCCATSGIARSSRAP